MPAEAPSRPSRPHALASVLTLQILFRAKDLDAEPRSHVVRGNRTQSALLAGLRKFVLYELQVLAFTRLGNGVPSAPLLLERTKDDGRPRRALRPPRSAFPSPPLGRFQLNFQRPLFSLASAEENKTKLFFSHWHLYGQSQRGVNFYGLVMNLCRSPW